MSLPSGISRNNPLGASCELGLELRRQVARRSGVGKVVLAVDDLALSYRVWLSLPLSPATFTDPTGTICMVLVRMEAGVAD